MKYWASQESFFRANFGLYLDPMTTFSMFLHPHAHPDAKTGKKTNYGAFFQQIADAGITLHGEERFKKALLNVMRFSESMTFYAPVAKILDSQCGTLALSSKGIQAANKMAGLTNLTYNSNIVGHIKHVCLLHNYRTWSPIAEQWTKKPDIGDFSAKKISSLWGGGETLSDRELVMVAFVFRWKRRRGSRAKEDMSMNFSSHVPPFVFYLPAYCSRNQKFTSFSIANKRSASKHNAIAPIGSPHVSNAKHLQGGKTADIMRSLAYSMDNLLSNKTQFMGMQMDYTRMQTGVCGLGPEDEIGGRGTKDLQGTHKNGDGSASVLDLAFDPHGAGRRIKGYNMFSATYARTGRGFDSELIWFNTGENGGLPPVFRPVRVSPPGESLYPGIVAFFPSFLNLQSSSRQVDRLNQSVLAAMFCSTNEHRTSLFLEKIFKNTVLDAFLSHDNDGRFSISSWQTSRAGDAAGAVLYNSNWREDPSYLEEIPEKVFKLISEDAEGKGAMTHFYDGEMVEGLSGNVGAVSKYLKGVLSRSEQNEDKTYSPNMGAFFGNTDGFLF